jgi:hypothetical protein
MLAYQLILFLKGDITKQNFPIQLNKREAWHDKKKHSLSLLDIIKKKHVALFAVKTINSFP